MVSYRQIVGFIFLALAVSSPARGEPSVFTAPVADVDATKPEIRALLVPLVESTLSSQIAARIARIHVNNGDRFREGEPLITFDCDTHQAQLMQAKAELFASTETHKTNLKMQEQKAVSKLEVTVSAARVQKAKAEAALQQAQVNMCEVQAPFDGRVAKVRAKAYENASVGQPLIEILDDSRLKMELYVPSRWLLWLKPDMQFTVIIDETGKRYPATVTALGARVDAVSQTLEITALVQGKHDDLLAGMSGVASFKVPDEQGSP